MSVNFRSVLDKLKSEHQGEFDHGQAQEENTLTAFSREQLEINKDTLPAESLSEPVGAGFDNDSIELYLFKSNEEESLGLQLNEFLVVVSVQNGSPAYHANVPSRHRVVTVNQHLVSNLDDFGRALSELENPLEVHLRLAPPGQKTLFYPELVDKVVVRMLTEADFDLSVHRVNPRYEFLNESSPYHNVFRQRYDATTAALEFLDKLVVSFKADKFSKSVQSVSYHVCTADEYDSAARWLDGFIDTQQLEEKTKLSQLDAVIEKSKNASSISAEHAVLHDGCLSVIMDAPMVGVPENAVGLEEALRISEEALTSEIPYDPFLYGPEGESLKPIHEAEDADGPIDQ